MRYASASARLRLLVDAELFVVLVGSGEATCDAC